MTLEIKWPWEMTWMESADGLIAEIKEALPKDHELQSHNIFPGIKWDQRPIFVVDDDTAGERILMNFENMKRWKKTKSQVPEITVFKNEQDLADMIQRDHETECAKYNSDGTLNQ
jgi:hypothetical protein